MRIKSKGAVRTANGTAFAPTIFSWSWEGVSVWEPQTRPRGKRTTVPTSAAVPGSTEHAASSFDEPAQCAMSLE